MILIVEDHRDTAEALGRLLQKGGYECASTETGSSALARMRDAKPALIILDYMLPDMDGYQILRTVKSDPRLRDIPVIMYSAVLANAARSGAMEAGATRWISKGADAWGELLAAVRDLCPQSGQNPFADA